MPTSGTSWSGEGKSDKAFLKIVLTADLRIIEGSDVIRAILTGEPFPSEISAPKAASNVLILAKGISKGVGYVSIVFPFFSRNSSKLSLKGILRGTSCRFSEIGN